MDKSNFCDCSVDAGREGRRRRRWERTSISLLCSSSTNTSSTLLCLPLVLEALFGKMEATSAWCTGRQETCLEAASLERDEWRRLSSQVIACVCPSFISSCFPFILIVCQSIGCFVTSLSRRSSTQMAWTVLEMAIPHFIPQRSLFDLFLSHWTFSGLIFHDFILNLLTSSWRKKDTKGKWVRVDPLLP